ncbi:hypothetical protein V1477_004643 [Vespula maculifrons]|uniref:Uncharacterized protein n=1 Tax=Vespula maculifrons TaxID=7453 RepID=A0ABD2CMD6_VESMC
MREKITALNYQELRTLKASNWIERKRKKEKKERKLLEVLRDNLLRNVKSTISFCNNKLIERIQVIFSISRDMKICIEIILHYEARYVGITGRMKHSSYVQCYED